MLKNLLPERIVELVLLLLAVLTPQFMMAQEVDGDEYSKATAGVALGAVVVTAYNAWKHKATPKDES